MPNSETRFKVDANCSHCEDVPTKCRKCGNEYPKQLLAKVCELRHPEPEPELLTTAWVAKLLDIQPSTWRSYVSRGQAPAADGWHDSRTPFWRRDTIEEWKA